MSWQCTSMRPRFGRHCPAAKTYNCKTPRYAPGCAVLCGATAGWHWSDRLDARTVQPTIGEHKCPGRIRIRAAALAEREDIKKGTNLQGRLECRWPHPPRKLMGIASAGRASARQAGEHHRPIKLVDDHQRRHKPSNWLVGVARPYRPKTKFLQGPR